MIPQPDQSANIRATGARFEERAEQIATVIRRIDSTLEPMTFAGPAADQFRRTALAHRTVLVEARTSLVNGAGILRRAAARAAVDGAGPGAGR